MSGEIDLGPSRRLTHHLGYDGNGRWGNQAIGSDDFATPALMLASTVPYGQQPFWRAGHRLRAGGFDYIIAAAGATDHHLVTAGQVKLSAAVHRAGGGMGRIRGQSVNCSVGYRNAGPTTNLALEHVDFLVQANAGQLVFDGFARSHAGQRWDIRGTVDGAYVDLARNGGTLTIATADAAGATIAPTHNRHLLTCQADGNYVITNITAPGWARPGDRFQFSTVTGPRDVTFTPTTGNLRCNAGANRVLDTPADRIEFEFDGTNFVEISFANNV